MKKIYDEFIKEREKKVIIIEFEKILEQEGIEHINEFQLEKRAYYRLSDMIIESIKRAFNNNDDNIILPYLKISYKTKNLELDYPVEDFKKDLKSVLNKKVRKYIMNYINDNYVDNMDEATNSRKKVNEELQFTDQHAKILLYSAESIRLVIPLICDYCNKRVEKLSHKDEKSINKLLYNIYQEIIESYEVGKISIMNKIHRFIYSRVVSTQYSDRRIWLLLSNKSSDVNTMTIEFMEEIIIGVLPRGVTDLNIINLLHVVVKNKLGFAFQKNHKVTFNPVNLNQVDSEGLTQFDKWEISMTKKNEAKIIINQMAIKFQIKNIAKNILKIKISNEEFEYYKNRIYINKFQTNLLFLFLAKYNGSYSSYYNCSRDEYIYLLIVFYKWLKKNNFSILSEYLIALPDRLNEKRMTSRGSKLIDCITSSKTYKELLKNKYYYLQQNITESNIIIKLIGNLSVSKYNRLTPYNEFNGEDVTYELTYKVEHLADEILDYLKLI